MSVHDTTIPPKPARRAPRMTPEQAAAFDRKRRAKDRFANGFIVIGGIAVLLAILLIFYSLLKEAWPLFSQTDMTRDKVYPVATAPAAASPATGFLAIDERDQVGMRLLPSGLVQYFDVKSGQNLGGQQLALPAGAQIVRVQRSGILQGLVGVGLSNGQLLVFRPNYSAAQDNEGRARTQGGVVFPFGNAPLTVNDNGQPLDRFALREQDGALQVFSGQGSQLHWQRFASAAEAESGGGLMDEANVEVSSNADTVYTRNNHVAINLKQPVKFVFVGQGGRWLYALDQQNQMTVLKADGDNLQAYQTVNVGQHGNITAANQLQGEISLLLGTERGRIDQWFMVRQPGTDNEGNERYVLTPIRHFQLGSSPITVIEPEQRRKGILAGNQAGEVGYFYTTSERTVDIQKAADTPITALALSNHSSGLLVDSRNSSSFWDVDAHHPDVSIKSLWGKVWYESYAEPQYVWQSTSGNQDFESKMSLIPLTFGTLKAAIWAMILAVPLAIAAAMYTAAFMSPSLRTRIKPTIELMQALPTVILGFLAGLWLAPLVTDHLPAIFALVIILPLVMLLMGFLWMQLPLEKRNRIPDGIAPVMLILPLLLTFALVWWLSPMLEHALFASHGGSMIKWMESVGIDYQSQNALIVGLIMGFAVIAPIYSIAEDALFAVPRHLVNGSLALGATPWQTLTRVVLPTASPGIFSAVMIGFGRAVGETMIVLMATGNTPIMDFNIFEGMRTLSANLAVEMGEAELGSTHLRVLFLSALVLFILTFIVNTAAELVRARLRKKYGSL